MTTHSIRSILTRVKDPQKNKDKGLYIGYHVGIAVKFTSEKREDH